MTDKRRGDWVCTFSGVKFWPIDPRPDEVRIEDIAHALSQVCRYGGHCRAHYSVAEHSLLVSRAVPKEHALCGLLHDAAEAYVGDVTRPVKRSIPRFDEIEQVLWGAIAERFGLPQDMPAEVKAADDALLSMEVDKLMPPLLRDWLTAHGVSSVKSYSGVTPDRVVCMAPKLAEREFLRRFDELLAPDAG